MGADAPSPAVRPVRVVVADGRPMWVEAIKSTLGENSNIEVAAEATEWSQALREISQRRPDVVLVDDGLVASPEGALEQLQAMRFRLHVVFISESADSAAVYEAMAHGATGYLTRELEPSALIEGILGAAQGRTALSPALQSRLTSEVRDRATGEHTILSDRERDVLQLVADGARTADIAAQLEVSPGTVKHALGQIYTKLDVRSRAEAVAVGLRRGFVT